MVLLGNRQVVQNANYDTFHHRQLKMIPFDKWMLVYHISCPTFRVLIIFQKHSTRKKKKKTSTTLGFNVIIIDWFSPNVELSRAKGKPKNNRDRRSAAACLFRCRKQKKWYFFIFARRKQYRYIYFICMSDTFILLYTVLSVLFFLPCTKFCKHNVADSKFTTNTNYSWRFLLLIFLLHMSTRIRILI